METLQRILVRVANFHRGLLLLFWLAFLPPHSFAQYMSRPISPSLMWRLDHNTELDRVLIIWILVMFTSKTRLVSPIYRREKERIQFPLATHIWRWMKSDREWISLGLGCMQERSDGTDWIREQSFQPLQRNVNVALGQWRKTNEWFRIRRTWNNRFKCSSRHHHHQQHMPRFMQL